MSLKNKIEELFKELEEADGSGSGTDGESDDDELSMLIEHENRGTDDPAVCEEPEVGNPAKVPRIESGSLSPIKRSVGPRTSSPAPSITTSIPDSHNSTQDYGMTSDDVADDMGFLFVPASLPNINDQNSGKIINKVISLHLFFHMNDTHTCIQCYHYSPFHECYFQIFMRIE